MLSKRGHPTSRTGGKASLATIADWLAMMVAISLLNPR
jgi:hypothetical protein